MLSVTADYNRHPDKGQFYVELIELHEFDPHHTSRVGYWCDSKHLHSIVQALLRPFVVDLSDTQVNEILTAIKDQPLRKGDHVRVHADPWSTDAVSGEPYWKCTHTGCVDGLFPRWHFTK